MSLNSEIVRQRMYFTLHTLRMSEVGCH